MSGRSGPRPVFPLHVAGTPDPLTLNGAPLSVLDLAPIPDGGSAGEALRATPELAKHAESLGFTRLWVAGDAGLRELAPAGADRAHRRRDGDHPGRLRRCDAAEPHLAGGRRAVRHARGA